MIRVRVRDRVRVGLGLGMGFHSLSWYCIIAPINFQKNCTTSFIYFVVFLNMIISDNFLGHLVPTMIFLKIAFDIRARLVLVGVVGGGGGECPGIEGFVIAILLESFHFFFLSSVLEYS